jgi:CDP-4-dehydro-6-deoxyglucose reductase
VLTEQEQTNSQAVFCQALAASDLEIEIHEVSAAKELGVRTLPCRVVKIENLSHDVKRLQLSLPATERLQFLAGQYIDILLRDGRRRSFSLANAPHDDKTLELHIRHTPGGRFTDFVFNGLKERALLRFEGPLGTFFLREESSRPIIMVAGGTGFAPIKGMIEHLIQIGLSRTIHLFWGARSFEDLYLHDLVCAWEAAQDNIRYTPVLSEPIESANWQGERGLVHQAVLRAYPDLCAFQVYMSGPPAMIQAGRAEFTAAGLPDDQLFFDSFDYASDTLAGMDKVAAPSQMPVR